MSGGGLKLLIVNWLDIKNPQAGGAEIHLHEISAAWPYYLRHLRRGPFDLMVEDINKLPLFTPLWGGPPVVALVPHLFGATAFQEATPVMAAIVWLAERPIPYFYENVPFQAISESTAADLADRGLSPTRIRVVYPGIDHELFHPDPGATRFPTPSFLYVGRLKRYKGLERVIEAMARLQGAGIPARLLVAGKGDHEPALRDYAAQRAPGLVEFLGYVPEADKVRLLHQAWAAVYPSPKEGWGITNIEAAACGTPAVASDSPGLRESVAHGVSGLLVRDDEVDGWTSALRRIAEDAALRLQLAQGAAEFARRFSWDRTADETEAHLLEVATRGYEVSHDHITTQVREAK